MASRKNYRRVNNRKNSVVYKHLQETTVNSIDCFKETVRRRESSRWDVELEITIEELFRSDGYEPIYGLLLNERGLIEKWATQFGNRLNIDWHELFSDFQLHLFNILEGIPDKAYNREISFLNNLYKQLECVALDKRKYLNRDKRKWDKNCIPQDKLEQIPEGNQVQRGSSAYDDIELLLSIERLPVGINRFSIEDKNVLLKLATGEINKKDIPIVLKWSNKDDRKKLSRYCKNISKLLLEYEIISSL